QLTFNWEILEQADAAVTRIADCLGRLGRVTGGTPHDAVRDLVSKAETDFRTMVAADLNIPGAIGVIFDLVRDVNSAIDRGEPRAVDATVVLAAFERFDLVLGVMALRRTEDEQPPVPIEEIEHLIAERRDARMSRRFARADEIRRELEGRGIILEDGPAGTR